MSTPKFISRFPALKRLRLGHLRRSIPVVRQLAATDCGAAALAMTLGYFGKTVPLAEIRKEVGVGRNGATAASILRAGRKYGLRGRGVRLDTQDLEYVPAGAILYWDFRHFVVFERAGRDTVEIVDPSCGRRSVSFERFRESFTGVALFLQPTDAFEPGKPADQKLAGLFGVVLECRELLLRLISTSVLVQILSLAMPLVTGVLIDRVVPRKNYSFLLILAIGYCVFEICNVVASYVRSHLMVHFRTQLEVRFTLRFIDHLVDLPYEFFQLRTSGDLMVRLGSNNTVRDILTSAAVSAFMDGSLAVIYLGLLLLTNAWLAMLVLGLALARVMLLMFVRWKQRQFLAAALENQARSQTAQVEMLSGMETLKAMGLEHRAAEHWSNLFVDGMNISIGRGKLEAVFNGLIGLLGLSSTLLLMFYGAYLVLEGAFTLGRMMAFNALALGFLNPLNNLVGAALQLQMLEVYVERLNDVLRTPKEQNDEEVVLPGELHGAIELDHVSFRYSSQDRLVVDDVSLKVTRGSRVALVGRTGSGKSTIARLIAGLYNPASGRILFDDKDLRTLDRQSVRHQLGIVTQDTQLFSGSIRRNIAISDLQMGLSRVVQAAKLAGIHEEIAAMPMGYETMLTDRGMSLSGGQRQRLALARALASGPAILILDEATSHLDTVTEERVNRNLASLRCTRIVVAHRLSTIQDADQIVVIEAGHIVEQGTHRELSSLKGAYARLLGEPVEHPQEAGKR